MKAESSGLISRLKSNKVMAILIFVLICFVVVIGYMVAKLLAYSESDQHMKDLVSELRASTLQLSPLASKATDGDIQAFNQLERIVSRTQDSWQQLKTIDGQTRAALSDELLAFEGVWSRIRENSQVITSNEDVIILMHKVATSVNEALPAMQGEHDNIVEILLESGAPSEQVSMAQRQSWFAERIGRNVEIMLRGGEDSEKAASEFNIDANRFKSVLDGMKTGDRSLGINKVTDPQALESLNNITNLFDLVAGQVQDIFEQAPSLYNARRATTATDQTEPFQKGEDIQILEGPLAGLKAVFQCSKARDRVQVLIHILGAEKAVELPADSVSSAV